MRCIKSSSTGEFYSNTSYLKKQEKQDNLTLHLKQLEKEEQKKSQN